MKKYVAEFIGTLCLVFMGCGTAMLIGCDPSGSGYIMTALAFGLTIVAMAYSIGNISGCHINPAVSIAICMRGGLSSSDLIGYIVAQILGAFAGSGLLALLFRLGGVEDKTGGLGANGLAGVNGSIAAGILVEVILTFFFIICILGVTSSKQKHGSFGGLVIGLALTFVHIFGIGLTGTSVNPARSIGPAIIGMLTGNAGAAQNLWVFIVAPVIGAVLASAVYSFLEPIQAVTRP